MIWRHGRTELRKFLIFLNNLHPNIHFTIDIKENRKLSFLDVLVSKKGDDTLGYQMYKKTNTHRSKPTCRVAPSSSTKKQFAINSLVYRAFTICDKKHVHTEFNHLKLTLQENGHDKKDIIKTINKHANKTTISNTTR